VIYVLQEPTSKNTIENTSERRRNTQKIPSYVSLTRRAHKSDKTFLPKRESSRIITRARMLAIQRKAVSGRHDLGSAEPQVRPNLDAFPAAQSLVGRSSLSPQRRWPRFPYIEMAGTDIEGYSRRRAPHPQHTTHFGEEEVDGLLPLVSLG
jgi:hypothetical protein